MKKSILIIILIIALAVLVPLMYIFNGSMNGHDINGNGQVVKIEQKLHGLDAIHISGIPKLVLKQDTVGGAHVTFELDSNLRKYLIVKMGDGVLSIKQKEGVNINHYKAYNVTVTFNHLSKLNVNAVGRISAPGPVYLPELNIDNGGVGSVLYKDLHVKNLHLILNSIANADFQGTADTCKMNLNAVANFDAGELKINALYLDANACASVTVDAEKHLDTNNKNVVHFSNKGSATVSN